MTYSPEHFQERFPGLSSALDAADRSALFPLLQPVTRREGEHLVRTGEPTNSLWLVWAGVLSLRLERPPAVLEIGRVLPGRWVGELGLMLPGPSVVTMRAESDCTLLELTASQLDGLARARPTAAAALVRELSCDLSQRIRACSAGFVGVQGPDGVQRFTAQSPRPTRAGLLGSLGRLLGVGGSP